MDIKLGYADFTFFLSKFKYKVIDDMGILDRAAKLNLQCVQCDLALKMEPAEAKTWRASLKEKADGAGIEIVGAAFGEPDVPTMTSAVKAGAEMGARVVRYACGPMLCWKDPLPPADLVEVLKEVAQTAEKENVYFCLENHQDYTAPDMIYIMESVGHDRIGVYLDTGNSLALMEEPLYTVESLAPFARGIHMKEYVIFPSEGGFDLVGVGLGDGLVDNAKAMEILKAKSPADPLLVTIENPLERCKIPILHEKYVARFGDEPMESMDTIVQCIAQSLEKYPDRIVLPQESDMAEDDIVAYEYEHNEKAVKYCRETLGL